MTWFGGVLPCTVPEDSSLRTRHKNTKTKTMKQLAVFAAFALASSSLAALSGVAEVPRGPTLKERLNRPTLENLCHRHELSTAQIGARYGVRSPQILKLMDEYGIPRRSRGAGKT